VRNWPPTPDTSTTSSLAATLHANRIAEHTLHQVRQIMDMVRQIMDMVRQIMDMTYPPHR
jgi:hypothetical protein